jgi:hypothetical protein
VYGTKFRKYFEEINVRATYASIGSKFGAMKDKFGKN